MELKSVTKQGWRDVKYDCMTVIEITHMSHFTDRTSLQILEHLYLILAKTGVIEPLTTQLDNFGIHFWRSIMEGIRPKSLHCGGMWKNRKHNFINDSLDMWMPTILFQRVDVQTNKDMRPWWSPGFFAGSFCESCCFKVFPWPETSPHVKQQKP